MVSFRGQDTVVFVVQWLETFDMVSPVVNALAAAGWSVKLVVTPERSLRYDPTSDGQEYDHELAGRVWSWLSQEHAVEPMVDPTREAERLRDLRPSAVFLPSPYDGHRHASLSPAALKLPIHYVNYGFNIWPPEGAGMVQFDLGFYRECAAVYAENEYSARGYVAAGVHPARVIRTGHPAFDHWDRDQERSEVPTVLWCPWWSTRHAGADYEGGYSTFIESYDAVLREAELRPAMRFIARPHPMLWSQLRRDALWTEEQQSGFFARVAELDNFTVEGDVSPSTRYPFYTGHVEHFAQAWAMITDGVSFLAEFAYTGKPLLLTEAANSPGFNEIGAAIAGVVDRSAGPARLVEFLDCVEADNDTGANARRELVQSLFFRPAGGSAAAIARHLERLTG